MDKDLQKIATQLNQEKKLPSMPTPKQIGAYQIESLLNVGGTSYLYLAKHPTTSELVVIKVIRAKYLKDWEMLTRLLNEAKVIGLTNHPNIVKLYDFGQWEKGVYVAMEYVRGVSLRQFIVKNTMTHKRAMEIVLQIAYALAHLHAHGVIHRDLKPDNIIMMESGDIKLIDFGLAQFLVAPPGDKITRGKVRMGTPNYMSPEQKENPDQVSYGTDIFSLGIIAYELYLGKMCYGVIRLDLLPPAFRKIIEKALQVDPSKRYQDIVDFISDLSQFLKRMEEGSEEMVELWPKEMLFWMQSAQKLLLPAKAPKWPQCDIGVAVAGEEPGEGIYLDFFPLKNNRYAVLVAVPTISGPAALTALSTLRGMARMLPKESPTQIFSLLNQALWEDPMKQPFRCSLLLLNPERDTLSFATCDLAPLMHLPAGQMKLRSLATPNSILGGDADVTPLEVEDRWETGDTLILTSHPIHTPLDDLLFLAPQPLAQKALTSQNHPKSSISLVIKRV